MSATLTTFLLQTPRRVNSVTLLGSWDNFSKPYSLKKDTGLGSCYWRGCFLFEDIICDGEDVSIGDDKRSGPLLQGGKYWYYYQLDDEIDFCNPKQTSTTLCPFLPGQEVNIMEVPVEGNHEEDSRTYQGFRSLKQFTLDPEDRFRTPNPPASIEIGEKSLRDSEGVSRKSKGRRWSRKTNLGSSSPSQSPEKSQTPDREQSDQDKSSRTAPPSRAQSLGRTASKTIRRWRSVVSRLPSRKANKNEIEAAPTPPVPDLAHFHGYEQEHEPVVSRVQTTESADGQLSCQVQKIMTDTSFVSYDDPEDSLVETLKEFPTPPTGCSAMPSPVRSQYILDDYVDHDGTGQAQADAAALREALESDALVKQLKPRSSLESFIVGDDARQFYQLEDEDALCSSPSRSDFQASPFHPEASPVSSRRTSGVLSTVLDSSTSQMDQQSTPWRLSQPLTPTLSEFGEFKFETTSASPGRPFEEASFDETCLGGGGFSGYNIPEAEMSALTIRNLETANSKSSEIENPSFEPRHRDEIIRAWKAGANLEQHQQTTQQELVDDLAYLGTMII